MTAEDVLERALCGGPPPVSLQHGGDYRPVTNDRACLLQPHVGGELAHHVPAARRIIDGVNLVTLGKCRYHRKVKANVSRHARHD